MRIKMPAVRIAQGEYIWNKMTKFNLYLESQDSSASVAWSETVIVSVSSVLLFLDFARRDEDARLNLKAWSEVFIVAT